MGFLLPALSCVYGFNVTHAQPSPELNWFSFGQLTAERLEGRGGRFSFGSDRLRAKVEVARAQLTAGLMVDFGPDDLGDREPGALANVLADVYLNYRLGAHHLLRFGQFKTPLGMDFNVSGQSLDITKRGMEAGLVLERDLGVMLSGRGIFSNFGYDLGLFNPAGRSDATQHVDEQVGEARAPVARLHYDASHVHAELAFGKSTQAGGPGTENYRVRDFGLRIVEAGWSAKLEWLEGRDIRGIDGWDERVYYVHGGYRLGPAVDLVARHYDGKSTLAGATSELRNTFLGATVRVLETERLSGRLQINYVIAGGDGVAYSGISGFRDDAILVQFQVFAGN